MMTLITAHPGTGKTLLAMWMLEQEYHRNRKANALPQDSDKWEPLRDFYTNIAGATLAENKNAFPWLKPIPDHNDWTQLPDGSYVVYDEAHSDGKTAGLERYGHLFPSTGKPGESNDPRIRAMSTHRHRGFDLVFLTQGPTKVHHQLRGLCVHTHMSRAMGLAAAGILRWNHVQLDCFDEKQREKAEEEIWTYPKHLYKRYRSSTLHTVSHKFKLPKKVKNGLITGVTLLVMLVGAFKFFGWNFDTFTGRSAQGQAQARGAGAAPARPSLTSSLPTGKSEAVALLPGTGAFAAINTEPVPELMGCVSSDRGCRCFNADGFQIDMSRAQCLDLLRNPLPFNVAHKFASERSRERRDDSERDRPRVVESDSSPAVGSGDAFGGVASYGRDGLGAY